MKITKIEKKKRLYLVELDDWEKLYVTEDTIVRYFLTKGLELSEEELEEIRSFAQFSYGKNLALYHLSFKARTKKEVRDYLTKHEINPEQIPLVIEALEKDKWLDDARYAQTYFEQHLNHGDKGPLVLSQKLQLKGVDKTIIKDLAENYDFEPLANTVAEKLQQKYEDKLSHQALLSKITQSLMTKGFPYFLAASALDNLDIEEDEEAELELLYEALEKLHRKYSRSYDGYELKQRLTQALARKGFSFSDINQALRDFL